MTEFILVREGHFCRAWQTFNTFAEQYAYMCDLKRTLDATVSIHIATRMTRVITGIPGPLRARDALWNRQDGIIAVSDCFLSAGMLCHYTAVYIYIHVLCKVLSYSSETHLLFTYGAGDREGTSGVETTDGISNIVCRDCRRKRKRVKFYGSWID